VLLSARRQYLGARTPREEQRRPLAILPQPIEQWHILMRANVDIPVIQWPHRIPYNQIYWSNWPTKANLAGGTNAAFRAHTGVLVITQLKAIQ
jgi:hypothetical protein